MQSRDKKFYACLILGSVFALIGIFQPPIGEISNSVLILVGQFLLLAAGVEGFAQAFKDGTQNIKDIVEKEFKNDDNENKQ